MFIGDGVFSVFSTKRIHSAASVRAKSLYTEVRAKQSNRAEKDTMENGYKNLEGSCMLRRLPQQCPDA